MFSSRQEAFEEADSICKRLSHWVKSGEYPAGAIEKTQAKLNKINKYLDEEDNPGPDYFIIYECQALIEWINGNEDASYDFIIGAQKIKKDRQLLTSTGRQLLNYVESPRDRSGKPSRVWNVIGRFMSIITFLLTASISKTYPIPAAIFSLVIFSVLLGLAINQRSNAQASNQKTRKYTSDMVVYVSFMALSIFVLIINYMGVSGLGLTSASYASSSPSVLAQRAVKGAKASTSFPKTIDSNTVMTDMNASGDTVQYYYELHGLDTTDLTEDSLKESIKPRVCSNGDVLRILKARVNLQYIYSVRETGKQYTVNVVNSDCA